MTTFLEVLLNIVAAAGFAALTVGLYRLNLKREYRARQVLMPVIAVIYCILAVLLFQVLTDIMEMILNSLIAIVPFDVMKNLLSSINLGNRICFFGNYVLLIVFIIIKAICLKVLDRIWQKRYYLTERTSGWLYQYEDDIYIWALRNKWQDLRKYLLAFFAAVSVLACVLLVLMDIMRDKPAFQNNFYPVLAVLMIGEISFYLNGVTSKEYAEDILGEDERSWRVFNYSKLRSVLKNIFGNRILQDSYVDHSENEVSTFGFLDEMIESSDRDVRNAGNYFNRLKLQGKKIDMHYVQSCLDMSRGKSILIYSPFYQDLTDYLVFTMMKVLLAHKKVLVIAGRDALEGDLQQWMDKSFFEYMHIEKFWKTEVLKEDTDKWDIGIVQFSEIHNFAMHKKQNKELEQVGFVLLIEPSRILASGQLGMNLLLSRCRSQKQPVYCACDRNCDGLVDALSHLLKTSITEVSASEAALGRTSELYWKADGPYMHHKILPGISRYLGAGSEIGAAAIHNQVSRVTWLSSERFPVCDMKWILGQYYQNFCRYAGLPVSQESVYRHFEFQPNLWQCERGNIRFLIVEDEFCNLFEAMRLFETRASEEGLINILSGEYLLRDYMLDNTAIFRNDAKAIPSIVTDYARTERNVFFSILMQMSEEPIKEAYIAEELRMIGIEHQDVYRTMQELFARHCSEEEPLPLKAVYKEEIADDMLKTVHMKYYVLGKSDVLNRYIAQLKNAYYIAEDEKGEKHYISSRLYGHVFQVLLPGQFFSYAGKYYEVLNITEHNGVIVRRAADHITDRIYYRQHRSVRLSRRNADSRMGSKKTINQISVIREFCDIEISTHGYYRMNARDDLEHAEYVKVNGIPDRHYHNKEILQIKLPGANASVLNTICILLSEMFYTIYPDTWQFIHVMSSYWNDEDKKLPAILSKLESGGEEGSIFFVEDSEIDMGMLVSIERNIRRYLEYVLEYLKWHQIKMAETVPEPPEMKEAVFEDMSDYTLWQKFWLRLLMKLKKQIVPESLKKKTKEEETDTPKKEEEEETDIPKKEEEEETDIPKKEEEEKVGIPSKKEEEKETETEREGDESGEKEDSISGT